ncbi:MAG: thiamine diphosphokinase [Clostridiales bacterium]|jgi:thiamine pyrophosphokinase|nr:thiamine diphosphokinase [Clostridiales bacterium]
MFGLLISAGVIEDYAYHRALLDELPPPGLVLCADGGLRHLGALGRGGLAGALMPDLILGDFDSADAALLERYRSAGTPIESHPADKDFTDTELAVERAAAVGCKTILVLGALGARIDHTAANLQLLYKYAMRGVRVALADEYGCAAVHMNGTLRIERGRVLASLLGLLTANPPAAYTKKPQADAREPLPNANPLTDARALACTRERGKSASPKISILPIGGPARGVYTSGLKYPIDGKTLDAWYTTGVSNELTGDSAMIAVGDGALLVMACADR